MECERCGACCQDFAVLITFSDVIRILQSFPEYSLRSIAQICAFPENDPELEFLSKYPLISILEEEHERKGYLILNWNPEKWSSPEMKIMCTFYDFKAEGCIIHGSHPRTCQVYPFMTGSSIESFIVDRPNRRCPTHFSADPSNPEGIKKTLQNLADELHIYWNQVGIWNLRPSKKKTWRDLALFLRQNKKER